MSKKYKLTSETKEVFGVKLHRIEALMDFDDVEKGDKGGWIEKETNLDNDGNAWVSDDARISGDAWVFGDARISGKLKVTQGFLFGWREKNEELTFIDNDEKYQLIGKGKCKVEIADNSKKQELLDKAEELIAKANKLKQEAKEL